ncbi:two-component sensor histidine kinase [Pimelobacter simplex]|uniref:histidine kinase n=1 Tax=Nocardioides simplex TaxID=2045 RepID=A0A0C5XI37_NOCSI|nr:histidine kinase [Pimelobacter simplex]AJR18796.1 Putative two-component system sensor kinase [Pimelobacter simplex]MCG8149363.1 two-component sensor histidine kinase [Pimelobacter simplex]GEB16510.1 two-component sensor histidine kinase [Pimelobacter simplex]SFM20082.1 Signal transduction histidine kinase [Pimelobacter simplex]
MTTSPRHRRGDLLLALAIWLLGLATLLGHPASGRDQLAAAVFGLACAVPLVGRRRYAVPAMVLIGLLGLVGQLTPIAALLDGPFLLAFATAVGIVGALERPWRAAGWAVAAGVPAFAAAWWKADEPGGVISTIGWLALAFAVGRAIGIRRSLLQARADADHAAHQAAIERRVADERAAIARDLHDVIAQSIESVSMQATVGLHLYDDRPAAAREALEQIRTASVGASREIRELLGLLRSSEREPARPASLDDLAALVAASAVDGPVATLEITGTPGGYDPLAGLTLVRVTQEALTNARRHAQADHVRVVLDWQPDRLTLSVADDGAGPPAGGPVEGYGLRGMRERLDLVGGTLDVGTGPGGGLRLTATVPREDRP